MNENIIKLIEHAERYSMIFSTVERSRKELFREKFAELIIKECINVCKSRVGNSDYNTGRMHCVSDIKDHFEIKS